MGWEGLRKAARALENEIDVKLGRKPFSLIPLLYETARQAEGD